jgi:peptide/nickel transport system ATP-binding protein
VSTADPVLAVDGLSLAIDGAGVVDDVAFTLAAGETLALVGESGCGKTLTALSIAGLLAPMVRVVRGSIRLAGQELVGLGERALRPLRGREVAMIFQEPVASLNPLLTVAEQLTEGPRTQSGLSRTAALTRAREMLVAVGIPDPDQRLGQFPFELSGGMCQRVMIAAALIGGPRLLIADEPTTALDVTIQAQILTLIRELARARGTAVLLITHDMGVVADMADRVAVMYAGRIVEAGGVEAVLGRPRHPYTRRLLSALPRLDQPRKTRLATIEGTVPDFRAFPAGCRFRPRCFAAGAGCDVAPSLLGEAEHRVACWHADAVAAA